jgi:hypothetical protein
MNCLYETVAGTYLRIRGRFAPAEDGEAMLGDAEESLEGHRASLQARERDLAYQCGALAKTALAKKRANDLPGARFALQVGGLLRLALGPCLDLL